ncbi:MAG TPA: nickel-dependent hydrogenase large subunit [Isosphaeraceae bacterium]|jgi:coenzyme F420-reducing hydrogenase alpha subunit|nr:nickel-dependent hydrogenase large subunit [Isosphaeraceae bacterium]
MPDEARVEAVERTIRVGAIARVEGEGALTIRVRDGRVEQAQLRIFEAPRFFEAFLRGRSIFEVPDITARICGICPVAYQISACHALEAAVGLALPRPLRDLRRLLYCGEWIESHVLHVAFLHAPDFLGFESAIAMAQARPEYAELVRDALALKKAGNAIVAALGGRAIHPINVRLGGFYRVPRAGELEALAAQLRAVRDIARALVRWTSSLVLPPLEHDYEFVALRHEAEYPMNEGRLVSSRGLDIAAAEFAAHFEEFQVPHSNALQCRRKGGGTYFVGPLARLNLNLDRMPPELQELARATGISWPCRNPYAGIVARSLEVAFAVDEALRLIASYEPPAGPFVPYEPVAGSGAWITEAPRGALYHRYESDDAGRVLVATIIPPTSQNQAQIEDDLVRFAPSVLDLPEDQAAWRCEQVVRNYDPCISCATHSLKLKVVRT